MKTFKLMDAGFSTGLILLFTWLVLRDYIQGDCFDRLITGYLTVGAWQSISMIVHAIARWNNCYNGFRKGYQLFALAMVLGMPLGSIYILMFLSPFLAVTYTGLCYYETGQLSRRPLAMLK
jgi:hypothetical protein